MQVQMKPIKNTSFNYIGEMEMENPVLLDVMSGRVLSSTKRRTEKSTGIRSRGYSLFGVPLADYPLVITDFAAVKDIVETK